MKNGESCRPHLSSGVRFRGFSFWINGGWMVRKRDGDAGEGGGVRECGVEG